MKIYIDHDQCSHAGAYSDRCLSATLRNPLGHERYCFTRLEEDGRPEFTVTLRFDGRDHTRVFTTEKELAVAGQIGWTAFVDEETPLAAG